MKRSRMNKTLLQVWPPTIPTPFNPQPHFNQSSSTFVLNIFRGSIWEKKKTTLTYFKVILNKQEGKQKNDLTIRVDQTMDLKDDSPTRSLSASFSSRKSLIFNSSLLISFVNTSISRSLILIWFLQFFISITASSKPYIPWKIFNLI